ncbi:hypothetical protein ACJX0J_032313, partial [Zea mays]
MDSILFFKVGMEIHGKQTEKFNIEPHAIFFIIMHLNMSKTNTILWKNLQKKRLSFGKRSTKGFQASSNIILIGYESVLQWKDMLEAHMILVYLYLRDMALEESYMLH